MTDPTPVHGSLLRRIHEVYPSLPDRERRVADIILNTPSEMPVWTATELAGWAEVSNASVSRLVQRLGYRSFEHARKDARALRETGSPLFMKETTPLEFSARSRSDLLAVETTVIKSTLEQLSEVALRESAIALSSARRVRVLGFRNSRFLADYLAAQLSQLRPDIASLAMDGQTLGEGIAGLGVDDAVVVVGLRRRPAQFSRIVQLIANQGAKVVLISDQSLREAPAFATWTFTCSVETPQPMDSCAGALTLLRLLSSETATVLGDSGIEHLKAVEDLREDLNELEVVPWEKY